MGISKGRSPLDGGLGVSPRTCIMLRILDANFNRLGEGLRVLEEVSRFLLNDAELSHRLKTLRHRLITPSPEFRVKLLDARDSASDVGAFADTPSEAARADILSVVQANARRAQESLRVLEEFGKLPEAEGLVDPARIKEARFALYDIERMLVSGLLRQEKRGRISGLYAIIDREMLRDRAFVVAEAVLRGGARVLQLRDKTRDKGEILLTALKLKELCAQHRALFIVNDDADLAQAADADGVHLGQTDLPLTAVRMMLRLDRLIGVSTHSLEQARRAMADGADYIAVGSIYASPTKPGAQVVGLDIMSQVKKTTVVPVVAIGGINERNIQAVVDAGADAVAVIGAIAGDDPEASARRLVSLIEARKATPGC